MIIINCHKLPESSHPTLVYGTHPNPYNVLQATSPTATPISHSSRRGSVTIVSSSSWISVELKSKQGRKCISSFVPQLDWTDTGGCLAPVQWTPSNAKLLHWILNQCNCPPHNLEIKYQETWQSLPLLKTCSKTPPCKITQRLSSSTKCFRKYSICNTMSIQGGEKVAQLWTRHLKKNGKQLKKVKKKLLDLSSRTHKGRISELKKKGQGILLMSKAMLRRKMSVLPICRDRRLRGLKCSKACGHTVIHPNKTHME